MKRQKFSIRKQKWILQELIDGTWQIIAERDGTNHENRQIGRWIGVPLTAKTYRK